MKKLSLKLPDSSHESFWHGRQLAKNTYAKTWGTSPDKVSDDYDHAILICQGESVKGNLNIKRRTLNNVLPSEKYFYEQHWKQQCPLDLEQVAELCSFSVCDSLSNSERIKVFRGLIFGAHLHAIHQGIKLYVTVQRNDLINTLVRLMKYPFFPSITQSPNAASVPDDAYWNTQPLPQLYYAHTCGASAYMASFKVLSSFLVSGFTLEELPMSPVMPIPVTHLERECNA